MKPSRLALYAIVGALAVLALGAVLYVITGNSVQPAVALGPPPALAPYKPGKPAAVPQVAFVDDKGTRLMPTSFKGRYVLLNLWAPWCAPCVKELPSLARLKAAIPKQQFDVIAVDVGRGTAADARAFLDSHGAKGLDTYVDSNIALLRAFSAFGLPLTILIDPQGREVGRAIGPVTWDSKDAIDYFKSLSTPAPKPAS